MNENIIGIIICLLGIAFGIFYLYSYNQQLKQINELEEEIKKIIDKQIMKQELFAIFLGLVGLIGYFYTERQFKK